MTKHKKPDTRPRFGWTMSLDNNPQWICEHRYDCGHADLGPQPVPVVVIPMPNNSAETKHLVRCLAKTIWP